ncbi:hypothetical protein AUJ46_03670 [Candidatus Peregrinibacteria bacterium CG1_02_54_53]|nr:MAG: hypothetical protein AUJ46_03670 [Candidatus Peregrinibacteria bacterium CG1_02_54_53]
MDFPYRIERTRNRTSSATFQGDGVLIRLAGRLSAREAQRHITSLLRRMARRFTDHHASQIIDPFHALQNEFGTLQIITEDGAIWQFMVTEGHRTSAKRASNGWTVRRGPESTDADFRKFLWRLLSISEQLQMEEMVHRINEQTFRAFIAQVRLRHMRSRFGSCAPKGRITLNTALLFVPEKLRTYVIIHELAHILHSNHSRAFWASVSKVLPAYEKYRRALKTYRLRD